MSSEYISPVASSLIMGEIICTILLIITLQLFKLIFACTIVQNNHNNPIAIPAKYDKILTILYSNKYLFI